MPRPKHPDRTKVALCRVCGASVTVSLYSSKAPRCIECSTAAMTANLTDLARGAGPYYDRWYAKRWPGKARKGRGTGTD